MWSCVLLIEHDVYLGREIGRGVRNAGFLVMTLGDTDEAIDLLRLVAFDLVLVDVGTLRYSSGHGRGLAGLLQVLRSAPLLRFTTRDTMGPAGHQGALVLEHSSRDLSRLLGAISHLAPARAVWPSRGHEEPAVARLPRDYVH